MKKNDISFFRKDVSFFFYLKEEKTVENAANTHGKITLTDRKTLVLDGVENVASFDESCVLISTALGEVGIEGEGLKIENLSKERGEILICGIVSAIYYKEKPKGRKKLFG